MRRSLVSALATALIAVPAFAAAPGRHQGSRLQHGSLARGKTFHFSWRGPCRRARLLYFYPAAFTPAALSSTRVCEATDKFTA